MRLSRYLMAAVGALALLAFPAAALAQAKTPIVLGSDNRPKDSGAMICVDLSGTYVGCGAGGVASMTATASAAPTPVVAGTGKPLNIGLFSNLFMTLVDASGNPIDFTATSPVSVTNLPTTVDTNAGAAGASTPRVVLATGGAPGAAGEAHLGEVAGNQIAVQVTPTVTAVAFTSGWAVGGLQTIANASRVSGGTGLLQDVEIYFKSNQTTAQAAMDIFLFSDTTLSSTCTNAAAFVLSSSDWAKLVGVIHVTDTTAGNTTTLGQALNLAKGYKTAATTLYACAVTRGTPTWGTTSDLTFSYNFIRN